MIPRVFCQCLPCVTQIEMSKFSFHLVVDWGLCHQLQQNQHSVYNMCCTPTHGTQMMTYTELNETTFSTVHTHLVILYYLLALCVYVLLQPALSDGNHSFWKRQSCQSTDSMSLAFTVVQLHKHLGLVHDGMINKQFLFNQTYIHTEWSRKSGTPVLTLR